MKIHSLFILNKNGACIYDRNFTEDFKSIEPNLITPFFSAIFSFSENVISQKTPEVLEMGGFRFVFQIKEKFIYTILSDSSVSLLFVKSRLKTITKVFEHFLETNEIEDHEIIQSNEFDEKIDGIITGEEEITNSKVLYKKIIDLIKSLVYENEILGAALFAINGKVIYTSLPQDILLSSIKELEIRFMVANEFDETFYSLENEQKVFSKRISIPWKLEPLLIVVLFDAGVPTGMAEVNLEKIVKNIENII
ncbi:MAG: hypothetical protein EU531_05940 [Promethearchaeota archaeon]|nr:MAG: hypothetical protein EU531_05940 [Candidatus Lokiarchaeota archaeon]